MRTERINTMKKTIICIIFLIMTCYLTTQAQNTSNPPQPDDRSPRQIDKTEESQSLTMEQKTQVKSILSKYNESSLTAADARAINEAFRNSGLRNGPALQQAIREAGFVPERIGALAPPPDSAGRQERIPQNYPESARPDKGPGGNYSIEQAISDRAQLSTIAFDGLAFLTGDFGCNTFLPPGKVADFCGFQYMRDVDINQLGHNTFFVPLAANNILHVLTDEQKAQLISLGKEQEPLLTEFATKRYPLIKAFCRQLAGDIPVGSSGLSREAVMKYAAQFYEIDGLLSYRRTQVLGGIIRSLTDQQKTYLAKMVFNNSATWPELPDQIDKQSLSHTAHVAVMTYASEMFSWYAGSIEADVYFCPERHATYFGSFYMKDIPAMGNNNYSISTSLTGDSGEAFLSALSEKQRILITNLVYQQRKDLNDIVSIRRAISMELRRFMKEDAIDKDKVMSLSKKYGELDGEISYYYCMAFAQVGKTLTADQKDILLKLRNLDARFTCQGAYLYSQAVAMPEIPNTDFFFPTSGNTTFVLRSPEVADGGQLPQDYTGDGTSSTLPLEWSGAPAKTKSYAIIMHHIDPEGATKWYWILYNIPATAQSLPKNVKGVGTLGNNSINGQVGYAPPHSKGPGAKTYIYTVYALSSPVQLAIQPEKVNRDVLLTAMKDHILASAELKVVYTQIGDSNEPNNEQLDRGDNRPNRQQMIGFNPTLGMKG
jgi:Raf kinase inhibitor-like YbhB/YbcL family protein